MEDTQNSGVALAWIVLIGLSSAVAYTGAVVWRSYQGQSAPKPTPQFQWATPILTVIGLGVAGYLTYVEVVQARAVCGPVGDCNAVQNSPYARLFGLPVGVIGLAGYGLILVAWIWGQSDRNWLADQMALVVFCAALFSVLFSIYLTWLEIFVIQAICVWCLTSAAVVTLILIISIGPMVQVTDRA